VGTPSSPARHSRNASDEFPKVKTTVASRKRRNEGDGGRPNCIFETRFGRAASRTLDASKVRARITGTADHASTWRRGMPRVSSKYPSLARQSNRDFDTGDLTLESTPDCILSMGANKVVDRAAKIGVAAKETGLSIDTIRFYEKEGLLRRSIRTEGGFRLFGLHEIHTLKFIRKSQELGFSLGEIRELLILRSDHVPACSHVQELLQQKLTSVEQKIEELRTLEQSLKVALRKCQARSEDEQSRT
jgi:MerR family transcriptional regulator, Zn(II)-responsive regulator of zntA